MLKRTLLATSLLAGSASATVLPTLGLPTNGTSWTVPLPNGSTMTFTFPSGSAVITTPSSGGVQPVLPPTLIVAASSPAAQTGYAGNSTTTASAVPALKSGFLAAYVDGANAAAMAQFETWLGAAPGSIPASIYGGNANEQDMTTSISYNDGVNDGGRPHVYSLPFAYHTGVVPGGGLTNAASGANNADFDEQATLLFDRLTHSRSTLPSNAPFNAGTVDDQTSSTDAIMPVAYIRGPWEFNQWNQASQDWADSPNPAAGSPNTQPNYIAGYRDWVARIRAKAAAYVPSSGIPLPQLKFAWCFVPQGDDPTGSYPGDDDVDVIAPDVYWFPISYNNIADPDTAFATMRDQGYSLTWAENFAVQHGKLFALPEWGEDVDNFGQFLKLMQAWLANLPAAGQPGSLAYAAIWDSTAAYPHKVSDGFRGQTDAMFRHVFNPTAYPVEPTPYPNGVTATGGNNQITIGALAVPSTANIVTYYLYEGPASGQENTTTPVASVEASAGAPSFTRTVANGSTRCYQMASARADGAGLYLSPESCATAIAPASNTPLHYVSMGASGFASTPFNSNQVAGASTVDIKFTHCLPSLTAIENSNSQMLGGLWGSVGYLQSLIVAFNNSNIFEAVHDNSGNSNFGFYNGYASLVQAGGCYADEAFYTPSTGLWTNYHDAAGHTGAPTLLNTTQSTAGIIQGTPSQDPQSLITPTFRLGQDSNGGSQFPGYISEMILTVGGTIGANGPTGGTVVLHPVATSTGFSDVTGAVWTLNGSATPH